MSLAVIKPLDYDVGHWSRLKLGNEFDHLGMTLLYWLVPNLMIANDTKRPPFTPLSQYPSKTAKIEFPAIYPQNRVFWQKKTVKSRASEKVYFSPQGGFLALLGGYWMVLGGGIKWGHWGYWMVWLGSLDRVNSNGWVRMIGMVDIEIGMGDGIDRVISIG
jgi:hypothetical protein